MSAASSQSENEQTGDRRSADIAVVCSHIDEVRPFLDALDRVRKYSDGDLVFRGGFIEEVLRVAVVEAGRSYAHHRKAAETLINEHNPAWLISAGFSSSLDEELRFGDICLAESLCDQHGNEISVPSPIPEATRIFKRRQLTTDRHPESADDKHGLYKEHNRSICDTSSLAVAQIWHERSTDGSAPRILVARVIVDEVAEDLTSEGWHHLYGRPGGQTLGKVTGWLEKIRGKSDDQWKTRSATAAKNLSRFLFSVSRQIGEKLGKPVL